MTGAPVTTNPFLIMMINMTIVFGVLILLGGVIRLITVLDPTRKKESPAAEAQQAVAAPAAESAAVAEIPMEEKELAAVAATAIMAYGYQNVKIKSIKKA